MQPRVWRCRPVPSPCSAIEWDQGDRVRRVRRSGFGGNPGLRAWVDRLSATVALFMPRSSGRHALTPAPGEPRPTDPVTLLLRRPAPDAGFLVRLDRESKTGLAHRARPADRLGGFDMFDGIAGATDRKEQVGADRLACGSITPWVAIGVGRQLRHHVQRDAPVDRRPAAGDAFSHAWCLRFVGTHCNAAVPIDPGESFGSRRRAPALAGESNLRHIPMRNVLPFSRVRVTLPGSRAATRFVPNLELAQEPGLHIQPLQSAYMLRESSTRQQGNAACRGGFNIVATLLAVVRAGARRRGCRLWSATPVVRTTRFFRGGSRDGGWIRRGGSCDWHYGRATSQRADPLARSPVPTRRRIPRRDPQSSIPVTRAPTRQPGQPRKGSAETAPPKAPKIGAVAAQSRRNAASVA